MGGKGSKDSAKDYSSSSASSTASASDPPAAAVAPPGCTLVCVNVYRPRRGQGLHVPGLGVYHSGVEIFDSEYVYAGGDSKTSGIFIQRPRVQPADSLWEFYQSVRVGFTPCRREEVRPLISELDPAWPASDYDVTGKNCNHFSEALCARLGVSFPAWINRAAKVSNPVRQAIGGGKATTQTSSASPGLADILPIQDFHREALKLDHVQNCELFTEGFVEVKAVAALNESDVHNVQSIVPTDHRLKSKYYVESSCDAQLLMFFPFTKVMKLVGIQMQLSALPDFANKLPKTIKFFVNSPNVDFSDVNDGVVKPHQTDVLETLDAMREDPRGSLTEITKNPQSKTEKKEQLITIHIPLKKVNFTSVNVLTIFVEDNFGASTTAIHGFDLFGRPADQK